jgi:cysteine desulfurase
MSSSASAALRQTSRLCSRRTLNGLRTPSIRGAAISASYSVAGKRGYVSESKKDSAQVNIDTAIKADQKKFLQQAGTRPENVEMPITGLSADAMMSPVAGEFISTIFADSIAYTDLI